MPFGLYSTPPIISGVARKLPEYEKSGTCELMLGSTAGRRQAMRSRETLSLLI